MNVAESIKEFEIIVTEKWHHRLGVVPVILIPPILVDEQNRDGHLNIVLDYFDAWTGQLQFFFPGYSMQRPGRIAITHERLGNIYYNHSAFSKIVIDISNLAHRRIYSGDALLLLIPHSITGPSVLQYNKVVRYNLSRLYHQKNGSRALRLFLEDTISAYEQCQDDISLLDHIRKNYNNWIPD